ncbi:cysteine synthase [Mycolicibacterium madagascariense]|uniref:Cysteine synthase n=1 Tax=Mycolicibacterium madagascariense TaxID=212765 RepID=A0A7I7XI77_9MYCO|nr:cysteine synthase family protein [Mycolicibacterium madagascariense]MCV7012775.1 cysteine synthase family protein [Mycolicibacterium madagascariense]BBZ28890.1 cysteine synthase [Mycolicibacterium madagascariense]
MIHDDVLSLIGETPIVRLRRLKVENRSEILVKLEAYNPGRSIKDRSALFMVEQAERDGRLLPGGTIIESTSGNLGKALALIGAVRGYRVVLVVDPKVPRSVLQFAAGLGATLDFVTIPDQHGGYQGPRIERVKALCAEDPSLFWPDQYNNPDNPRAHASVTATEILADLDFVDALVATVSTGGHVTGLSRTLKQHLPQLVTVAVDAIGSSTFGHPFSTYKMRGIGLAWKPNNLDHSLIDRFHPIADHEGIATSRVLVRHEGIYVGESSGAAIFAALHYAHHHPGHRVLVVAADDGVNYLGESFDTDWLRRHGLGQVLDDSALCDPSGLVRAAITPTHQPMLFETSASTISRTNFAP